MLCDKATPNYVGKLYKEQTKSQDDDQKPTSWFWNCTVSVQFNLWVVLLPASLSEVIHEEQHHRKSTLHQARKSGQWELKSCTNEAEVTHCPSPHRALQHIHSGSMIHPLQNTGRSGTGQQISPTFTAEVLQFRINSCTATCQIWEKACSSPQNGWE